jgi:RimJ/RimL family protein N-acetyltransferase
MVLDLAEFAMPPTRPEVCRGVVETDREPLAQLMLTAYRGESDDDNNTLEDAHEEIRKTFAGEYGEFLPDTSVIIERDGELASTTLITIFEERPFVCFTMTGPQFKRQGLALATLLAAIENLKNAQESELRLLVTADNSPALHLYEHLGFVDA